MRNFRRVIEPIVKAVGEANPKVGPLKKNFSTTISKQFSEKPKGTLNKPDDTPKADGESNGRNLTEKIPKNTISQSELIKTPSLTKPVNEVNLRQQAAEAFANLRQQNGEMDETSESTKKMVVESTAKLQEHFPHFRNAFQHSLEKSNTSVTELDSPTKDTSRDISDPKKQDSVDQPSEYPKTQSATEKKTLVIRDAEKTIKEISSDISSLEQIIKHESKIKDIQRRLDSYGVDSSFRLYNHVTDKGRKIEACSWAAESSSYMRGPLSKAQEQTLLKRLGLEHKVRVIRYSEECEGHKFNCHSYTVAEGLAGWLDSSDFQKYLHDNCYLIGDSDNLDKVQVREDDLLVHRGNEKVLFNEFKNMQNNRGKSNEDIKNLVAQFMYEGEDILHSSYVILENNGKVNKIIGPWGRMGIIEHNPIDSPSEYKAYYKLYRPIDGRLIRKAKNPSTANWETKPSI